MTGNAIENVKRIDNKITYILGYRNLLNYAVLTIAFWAIMSPSIINQSAALILFILGAKWLLQQARDNIDTIAIHDLKFNSKLENPEPESVDSNKVHQ